MKWAALLEFDVPVDLLEAMRVQKTACETIIGAALQPHKIIPTCSFFKNLGFRDKRRADPGVSSQFEIEGRRVRESIEEAGAGCRRASTKYDREVLQLLRLLLPPCDLIIQVL